MLFFVTFNGCAIMSQLSYFLLVCIATLVCAIGVARAQLPILTRQINIQHNGNGKTIQLSAPVLDSTYSLVLPYAQGAAGTVLSNDGNGSLSWTALLNAATINGTANYLTKFTSATSLGTSLIYDNGSLVGLGTASPGGKLHISTANAAEKGLILHAAPSATANMIEIQNSSGTALLTVSSTGDLTSINSVAYGWPSSRPSAPQSATHVGSGILEVASSGAMSWRQMVVTTATLNFPVTATRTSSDVTLTVNGVVSGDVVSLGVPNAAVLVNTCYTAWVSADNTVTVRFNNYDNAEKDPASAVFKVVVMK
ncbi:MAG: hypothetical protein RLZZ273_1470 [Bacteroidota bacterium]